MSALMIEFEPFGGMQKSCPRCLRIMKIIYFEGEPVGLNCEFCEFFLERKEGGYQTTDSQKNCDQS